MYEDHCYLFIIIYLIVCLRSQTIVKKKLNRHKLKYKGGLYIDLLLFIKDFRQQLVV